MQASKEWRQNIQQKEGYQKPGEHTGSPACFVCGETT